MRNRERESNYFYISVLTVLSSFAVVMLHSNGVFWSKPTGHVWLSANIIETLFYFAVPVFFMISGCTLIDYSKRYNTAQFFSKRATRTLIPFLLWSGVAAIFMWLRESEADWGVSYIISGILNHRFMYIYWFFMPLFAIYLCMPVLTDIKDKVRIFTYMAGFGLISISLFGFLRDCGMQGIPDSLAAPICGGFLIYPLVGYILHHTEQTRKQRWLIYAVGICATAAHFGFTYGYTIENGKIFTLFKNYLHISSVLQAVAVFVFVKYNAHALYNKKITRKTIYYLQPATLSVYLAHMYLLSICGWIGINSASLLFRTIGSICIFVLLALLIRQLQRVRLLRVFFP